MKGKTGICVAAAICAVAFLPSGCSSDECTENKNALPYAGFYESTGNATPQPLKIESLTVYGIGAPGDSLLADGESSLGSIYLPFRIDSDTTRFAFSYPATDGDGKAAADTVTFVYSRDARFVSAACGVSYLFGIKDIVTTHQFIDSVVCPGMRISNANRENIRIYFRVDDE